MDQTSCNVLIVDDNAEDRATYRRYLTESTERRYLIHEAPTGEQGLQKCHEESLHCILLDYDLPDMNGVDFLTSLRATLADAAPAVIMLTGNGNESVAVAALKSGAQDYLVKGLTCGAVSKAIHDAIENVILRQKIRQQAAELQEQANALKVANRRKDEFLASLAHEFRNPLSPIRSSMEILVLKYPDTPFITRIGEVVGRQVDHLTRLLNDLLDVARITSGKLVLLREDVLLSDILARVSEQCESSVAKGHHTFTIGHQSQEIILNADPVRLVQALVNIVTNACKFSPEPGPVKLAVAVIDNEIEFRVSDKGIGLSPASKDQIFEMFAQAGRSTTSNLSGMGIGLSLSKKFTEMHGGTIAVQSLGLGCGSVFILSLPILSKATVSIAASSVPTTVRADCQKRILIVDDNRDGAEALGMLFEGQAYAVSTAYNGLEAVDAAAAETPDVILMDIGLPGIDGYEAVRRIRKIMNRKQAVIIGTTGWGDATTRKLAVEAGFDHLLVKPIDFASLKIFLPISM